MTAALLRDVGTETMFVLGSGVLYAAAALFGQWIRDGCLFFRVLEILSSLPSLDFLHSKANRAHGMGLCHVLHHVYLCVWTV